MKDLKEIELSFQCNPMLIVDGLNISDKIICNHPGIEVQLKADARILCSSVFERTLFLIQSSRKEKLS